MNNETLDKMRQLRLYGMYDAFKTNLETSVKESLTADQFIALLVASEWDDRRNRYVERAIRGAGFRYKASLEQIDYGIDRGLEKNQVHRLAALDFVKEHKDLFITGSTGTGKSYLATALGYHACQSGYKVMYVNTAKLMGQLKLAKAKGTILAELKRIERADLLILDDFGLQPFDAQSRASLLDIIEDRYQKRSTLVTSQIPVKEWYDIIGEKTIADAILDRKVHHSLRVELYGESLRRRNSKSENVLL
jgi:DNA replication protein DnaC